MAADQVPAVPVLADTAGDALAALLEEGPALVKVNAGEATDATNIAVTDASSAADAATALRRDGAGVAIVTLGAGGAVVVTETERVQSCVARRDGKLSDRERRRIPRRARRCLVQR